MGQFLLRSPLIWGRFAASKRQQIVVGCHPPPPSNQVQLPAIKTNYPSVTLTRFFFILGLEFLGVFNIASVDIRYQISDFRFQIRDFRFHISDFSFRFRISDFRFQIANFRFQISDFTIQISDFTFLNSDFRSLCLVPRRLVREHRLTP